MLARQEAEFGAQEVDDSSDAEKGGEAAHLVTLPTAIAISLATAILSTVLSAGLAELSALLCPTGVSQVNQQWGYL